MATTTGQAIALGNIAQVPQDRPFTNAVINKQRLDLANQAQEAKRRSELEKNREAIAKSIDFKTSGVLPIYQDDVRDISATGMANAMAERDPIKRQSIIAKTQLELDNIKYNNDQLSSNLAAARTNGILPKEVIDVLYSPREEANKRYETLIKEKPEYAALLGKTDNGAWALNHVVAMPMNDILGQAATRLKSGAVIDASKTRGIGGGQNEFTLVADPNEVAQEAQAIASSKDWGLNVMLNDPKTYSTYFDKAVNDAKKVAEQTGVEPTKEEIQHAAILGYTADALKKKAVYTERKGQPTQSKLEIGFGNNGGYKTANKWNLLPADTRHNRSDLTNKLKAFNEAYGTEYTYEEFYKSSPAKKADYDEVVLENQDVSENKTFQYPTGKGGFVDVIPISIRRVKGSNDWVLVGKTPNTDRVGKKTNPFVDIELPYNEAVRQKTDAIVLTDTKNVLNEMFPYRKPTKQPVFKATVTTKSR